jgi:PAS domain S-box-containing protein
MQPIAARAVLRSKRPGGREGIVIGRMLRFARDISRLDVDPLGLGALLDATPNFIGVSVDERVAYANAASQRMLGFASQGEMLNRSVYDFVHPEDRERARAAVQRARQSGGPVPFFEVRMLAQGNDGAEKCEPNHQPARQLFRHSDAGVEGIAEHHIAEHQHDHNGEADSDD